MDAIIRTEKASKINWTLDDIRIEKTPRYLE